MVSADNLNLDVLELVFAYLAPGNDLVSVALVSRSFLAGIIPRLYETLFFRLNQAKRYSSVVAPFSVILHHPDLAKHVRHVDIRAVPLLKSPLCEPHPQFLRDCSEALRLCGNLSSFTCVCPILPSFLLSFQNKSRLQHFNIHAKLTTDQSEKLIMIGGLQSLTLDQATWNVVDILPKWIGANKTSLTSLTLHMAVDLNEVTLESTLSQLPQLLGLHVIGSPRVDYITILRCIGHTPLLESLSFTLFANESTRTLTSLPRIANLRHLSCDSHPTLMSIAPSNTSTSLFARFLADVLIPSSPPLQSLSIRIPESKLLISDVWINDMLRAFGGNLRRLSLGNCAVSMGSISNICRRCVALETLEVSVPVNETRLFTIALAHSITLHTLIDLTDPHATHNPKIALTPDTIKYMMQKVNLLRKIVCDGRIWTGHDAIPPSEEFHVSLEKKKKLSPQHWFMPQDLN